MAVLLLLLVAVPITLLVMRNRQEIRKKAQEKARIAAVQGFGKVAQFNGLPSGTNQPPQEFITVPHNNLLNPHRGQNVLAIEAWVKPERTTTEVGLTNYAHILTKPLTEGPGANGEYSNSYGFQIVQTAKADGTADVTFLFTTTYARFIDGSTLGPCTASFLASQLKNFHSEHFTRWVHLAGIIDGNSVHFYVNGEKVASRADFANGQFCNSMAPLTIGSGPVIVQSGNQNQNFQGEIDEVRISANGRYLWDNNTRDGFTPYEEPFTADIDTAGLWHFDALDDTKRLLDSSGNNLHATKTGSVLLGNSSLFLTPGSPPIKPLNLHIASQTTTTLNLQWEDNSFDDTRFELTRTEEGTTQTKTYTSQTNNISLSTTLPDWDPAKRYMLTVQACNAFGCSPVSNSVLFGPGVPTPTPTATPTASPTPTPTPSPTPIPTPTASPTPTPSPTPSQSPSPTPSPSPSPTPQKTGDINGDGKVDIRDLSAMLVNWLQPSTMADLNGDGFVNIRDLSILLTNWNI